MLSKLGITHPILQAPMAGVSTPELAVAVCQAGALGAISVGTLDAKGAHSLISATRALTPRSFNVNVFAHQPPDVDIIQDRTWLAELAPFFREFDTPPKQELRTIYNSILEDPELLHALIEARPTVVSFHFGAPTAAMVSAFRPFKTCILATATNLTEARLLERVGVDAIIAQGIEAGGHRGVFDPKARDEELNTESLVRLLVRELKTPIIAAGGIMDGAGIAAALRWGASAVQLGTAFIDCPESGADDSYRRLLRTANETRLTTNISGRPARCIANRFTAFVPRCSPSDYPRTYDAGKALHGAAATHGEQGFGAHWAGKGVSRLRSMPAGQLVETLMQETREALAK